MATTPVLKTVKKTSVLIVDDEPDIRELVKDAVHRICPDAVVLEASDGSEGYAKVSRQKFDLVVTDIKMPRSDGTKLLTSMNQLQPGFKPRSIFVLSGHISADYCKKLFGTVTYLSKPCPVDVLDAHIKKALLDPPAPTPAPASTGAAPAQKRIPVELINPFIDATVEILQGTAGIKAEKVGIALRKDDHISGDISAIAPLRGNKFEGSLAIAFDTACFLEVVKGMLGEEFKEITPEISDAAAEICNQIFGRAKKILNEAGHGILPTIPSIVIGKSHQIRHVVGGPCIAIEFKTPLGHFTVETVLKEN